MPWRLTIIRDWKYWYDLFQEAKIGFNLHYRSEAGNASDCLQVVVCSLFVDFFQMFLCQVENIFNVISPLPNPAWNEYGFKQLIIPDFLHRHIYRFLPIISSRRLFRSSSVTRCYEGWLRMAMYLWWNETVPSFSWIFFCNSSNWEMKVALCELLKG